MSRSKRFGRGAWAGLVLSSLVASGVLAGTIAVAAADDVTPPVIPASSSVTSASADLQHQIAARIAEIMLLSTRVGDSRTISSIDRGALNSMLVAEDAGLTNLQASASSDTSIAQIRTDSTAMVLNYHVYSFVAPVAQAVLHLDAARASATRITALIPSIKTTIVASSASAGRISRANSQLANLSALVSTINNSTYGVVAALLALAPTSVPASLPVVNAATATASSATYDVHAAYATIGRIVSLVALNAPVHHRR